MRGSIGRRLSPSSARGALAGAQHAGKPCLVLERFSNAGCGAVLQRPGGGVGGVGDLEGGEGGDTSRWTVAATMEWGRRHHQAGGCTRGAGTSRDASGDFLLADKVARSRCSLSPHHRPACTVVLLCG